MTLVIELNGVRCLLTTTLEAHSFLSDHPERIVQLRDQILRAVEEATRHEEEED